MNFMYPRNKLISVRVNEDLLEKFKNVQGNARYGKINVADLLETALKDYIAKKEKELEKKKNK